MKNLLKKFALLGLSLFIGVVLVEIMLRLFFPIPYSMEIVYEPDGHLGARLEPNHEYSLERGGICSINSMGFRRAGEIVEKKPAGTRRIVALGGSSTFCYATDDPLIWTVVLEKKLREKYGEKIEVINAGVPGYSAFESKINYLYRIRPLEPDVVIVYHTWNDMKRFHLLEQGIYPLKDTYQRDNIKAFLRNFQFAWRIRNVLHSTVMKRLGENVYGGSGGDSTITEGGLAHQWERENYDDLATWANADGVIPVFASQGSLMGDDNIDKREVQDEVGTEYQNMSHQEILKQWKAITKIIQTSAEQHDGLFVDVFNEVPHDMEYFWDHVHLTEKGNRLVADLLFDTMVSDARVDSLLSPESESTDL